MYVKNLSGEVNRSWTCDLGHVPQNDIKISYSPHAVFLTPHSATATTPPFSFYNSPYHSKDTGWSLKASNWIRYFIICQLHPRLLSIQALPSQAHFAAWIGNVVHR